MACNCNKKQATLRCTTDGCGRLITVSYGKDETPLDVAKKNDRRCTKCYSARFEVVKK